MKNTHCLIPALILLSIALIPLPLAAGGDPNGKGLPQWDPVGDKPEIMEVGDKTGPIPPAGDAAKFAFFERFLLRPAK